VFRPFFNDWAQYSDGVSPPQFLLYFPWHKSRVVVNAKSVHRRWGGAKPEG